MQRGVVPGIGHDPALKDLPLTRGSAVKISHQDSRRIGGFVTIEALIAMVILTTCGIILSSSLTASFASRVVNEERGAAARAARNILEDMRNVPFVDLYRTFNVDPRDDPNGEGTAPGHQFSVEGLQASPNDPDGFVGLIVLPTGTAALREDVQNKALGLPRDLNGDGVVDRLDHSRDYVLMPIQVIVEWDGFAGPQTLPMASMLVDMTRIDD